MADLTHHLEAARKAIQTAQAAVAAIGDGPPTFAVVMLRREAATALLTAISESRDALAIVEREWTKA